jgi:hypothetical protein
MKIQNTLQFSIIAITGIILTSCQTNTETAKVEQIASIIKSGTQLAVGTVTLNKPDSVKHFRAAIVGIKAALGAGDLTPAEVISTISAYTNSVGGTYAGVVEGGIGLALAAYQNFYIANSDKHIDEHLQILLIAISQGIESGIAAPPASSNINSVNPILELTAEDLKL